MRRRDLISVIATVAAWPLGTQAQQPKKMPRLCFLTFDPVDPNTVQSSPRAPFFDALRDLGYVYGQTITIDFLSADGSSDRYPALAADCLRLEADIIVATTTPAALAAKNATHTVPIVMYTLGDPVGTGLVDSLAHPGGNVTGTTLMATGISAKRLELLKEAVPNMARVLVLSYGVDPITPLQLKELERAAEILGIKLLIEDIKKADEIPAAFDDGTRNGAEG